MYKEFYLITYRVKEFDFEDPLKLTCRDDSMLESYIDYLKDSNAYEIKIYKVLETYELLYEVECEE